MRLSTRVVGLLGGLAVALVVGCGPSGGTPSTQSASSADALAASPASVTSAGAAATARSGGGDARPLQQVRITVPTKSITFLPFYFGQDKGIYREEGLDLELVQMRPPLGISALEAGDLAYSAAPGVGMRAAIQGAAIRAVLFVQAKPSFTLIGQPGIAPDQIKTVAVSGIGSTAHYAALNVMRKLGRGGPDDATYFATNDTAKSYQALQGKTADAAILSPPYTSMATVAGYARLGDAFDMVDVQGGLVTTTRHLAEQPAEVKALLRGTLRALEYIAAHQDELVAYMEREFELEHEVAVGSYDIVKQVLDMTGDMDEAALRSVVDQMKQDAEVTDDLPLDRVVALQPLREVQAELGLSR
ncbi:MAG TPA: ABC transporter substrate-binding protein [Chloroflexota bacterium]|nr:ABC transporter substrate-binding protein [Chloroflexota bacterium]